MKPFIPLPFPPSELPLESVVALVGRANASLSRYDGLLESLINPQVLLSPLLMKEAELSSRIEGTVATANEVYQQQAGEEFEPNKTADIQEILNYRQTLRLAEGVIREHPISNHLIRQMHETLMEGVRGEDKNPGRFRTTQNWFGVKGCKIEEATYIPPPPEVLVELLESFIEFVNLIEKNLDPLVQTALIHAQFELIHPFDDGNGRIGRLLIPLFLMKKGYLVSPSLYISGYLEANRDEYFNRLNRISKEGDWLGWVQFFLGALVHQAESNLDLVRQVRDLYDQTKNRVTELIRTDQAIHIVDMLFDTPVFPAPWLHQRLDIQRQRGALYLRGLKDAGLITEIRPSSGRRPAVFSFRNLWRIADQQ